MAFTDWNKMSHAERTQAIASIPGPPYSRIDLAYDTLKAAADLLQNNPPALAMCWHMKLGFFIVNTPEEIAGHCIAATAEKTEVAEC